MPVVFSKNIDDQTILSVWKIEETEEQLLSGLQLKQHELDVIASLSNGKRALHWLSTRLLLRTMLNTADYIDCQMDDHGKPYLVNSDTHISLSHSFDYAAVMISKSRPVGIDIEQIKQKVERIAPRFLSPAERATISADNKIEHLYVCWCAKEAVYKCYGQKEVSFLDNIALLPFQFATEGCVDVNLHKGNINQDYKVEYLQYEDYMLGYVKG